MLKSSWTDQEDLHRRFYNFYNLGTGSKGKLYSTHCTINNLKEIDIGIFKSGPAVVVCVFVDALGKLYLHLSKQRLEYMKNSNTPNSLKDQRQI